MVPVSMGSSSEDSKEGGAKHSGAPPKVCICSSWQSQALLQSAKSDRLPQALGLASPSHVILRATDSPKTLEGHEGSLFMQSFHSQLHEMNCVVSGQLLPLLELQQDSLGHCTAVVPPKLFQISNSSGFGVQGHCLLHGHKPVSGCPESWKIITAELLMSLGIYSPWIDCED